MNRYLRALREAIYALHHEPVRWHAHFRLEKREGDWVGRTHLPNIETPYTVIEREGNLLLTAGATIIWQGLREDGITQFDNTNSRICVGNSNTAASVGQTDLQGGSKFRAAMLSTWPKVGVADGLSGNQMQFKSDIGVGDGNFAWEEWGIANHASAGTLLNRNVSSNGTKSGGIWTAIVTLSLGS